MSETLLTVENLRVSFPIAGGRRTEVVKGVSFNLGRERLAIVGESGSGKSTTVRSLIGLAGPRAMVSAGSARFDGRELLSLHAHALSAIRGRRIAMIVQDPRQGLNPVRTVGRQMAEMLRLHRAIPRAKLRATAEALFDDVHIRDPRRVCDLYPHQLSGGMAQRVMIAMMLSAGPDLLIADEATAALDAVVQKHILELIDEQVKLRGMGLILISHDLELVSHFADRILVMYAGKIVETLTSEQGYRSARHPYTRGLMDCTPSLERPGERLPVLARDPAWGQ